VVVGGVVVVSGELALGAAISEDRQHASVAAAKRSPAGKVLVDLRFYDHPRLVVAWLTGAYAFTNDIVALVVNPKSQSGTLIEPLKAAGIIATEPTAEDVATAHGDFLDLIGDGGLEHLGQKPLTDAVRAGQQRPLSGAKAWDPRVAVDQGPLVAATLAAWQLVRHEELSSPGAWAL
jgi:hypothetical protein